MATDRQTCKAFLSSTFEDLKEHRAFVINALRKTGIVVDPMEDWSASPDEPKKFSCERIDDCDVLVLLVAFRRGYVPDGESLSITQLEHRRAVERGIPVLPFMLNDDAPWRRRFDERDTDPQIGQWRAELGRQYGVQFFDLEPDSIQIHAALARWEKERKPKAPPPAAITGGSPPPLDLESIRKSARRVSDDYLERMRDERVYVHHLYAKRVELEEHILQFLSARCTKNGMLILGSSGIGKTNTLCHMVTQWREDPARLGPDVVVLIGASTFPEGNFALKDHLLDRLEIAESFPNFVVAFAQCHVRSEAQLVLIVDGVDKHPRSGELLRQLDALIVQCASYPWLKVIVSIGEVAYEAIRKSGFVPAKRAYYTVRIEEGSKEQELCEVFLGRMNDRELADAYNKYRTEPGSRALSEFDSLTENVRNTIRHPLFLKIVMQIFDGRLIPRRVLTAEVLREYYDKKVSCDRKRIFLVNRFVEFLFQQRTTAASFDAMTRVPELHDALLDESVHSPYSELLEEQVLSEHYNKTKGILPSQRMVAFTYDRLLDYCLLVWINEHSGTSAADISQVTSAAPNYLPLRGALTILLQSEVDAESFDEAVTMLRSGQADLMKGVAIDLLMELEQRISQESATPHAVAETPVGRLVAGLSREKAPWLNAALLEVGEKLHRMGQFRRAGSIYEHALCLYELAGDLPGQESMLDAIGCVHYGLGQYDAALKAFERSLAIDEQLVAASPTVHAQQGKAYSLLNLAEVYHRKGNLAQASERVETAREIYEAIGDQGGLARATHLFGVLERRHGRGGSARRYHETSLEIHRQLADKKGEAQNLWGIGLAYLVDGLWAQAYPPLELSLKLHEELGDKAGIAYTCNSLGETARWEGQDLPKALTYYQRALGLYREMEAERDEYMVMNNLGATYLFAGDAKRSLEYLEQAYQHEKHVSGSEGEPETLAFMSGAALALGNLDKACRISDLAVEVLKSLRFGEEDIQLVYWYRYQILQALNQCDAAREALKMAYDNVMQQLSTVEDQRIRAGFIENFRLRREIVAACSAS